MKRFLSSSPAAPARVRPRARRLIAAVLLCCALEMPLLGHAAAASPAHDHRSEVESLLGRATALFEEERYDEAIALFEEAYALDPEANYLFNIGRVYEEKGDLETALTYYERFVRHEDAEPDAITMTQARIDALVAELESQEPPAPPTDASVVAPPPPSLPPSDPPPPATRARVRIAGYSLLGAGAALAAIGGGFAGAALARQRDLDDLSTLETRSEAIDEGERFALVADALFIAGGVVALTGLIMTLATLRKPRSGSARGSQAFGVAATGLFVHF